MVKVIFNNGLFIVSFKLWLPLSKSKLTSLVLNPDMMTSSQSKSLIAHHIGDKFRSASVEWFIFRSRRCFSVSPKKVRASSSSFFSFLENPAGLDRSEAFQNENNDWHSDFSSAGRRLGRNFSLSYAIQHHLFSRTGTGTVRIFSHPCSSYSKTSKFKPNLPIILLLVKRSWIKVP